MELKVEPGNLLKARKNVRDQARIGFSFHFRFPLSKLNWNGPESEIDWNHNKLRFQAFLVTPLSS